MSKPNAEWMRKYREENKEKILAQQKARDEKKKAEMDADPEKRAAYLARKHAEYAKKHPNARTKAEVMANKKERTVIPKGDSRACSDCGETKPLDDYPRHGLHGYRAYCRPCSNLRKKASRKASQSGYKDRNREKINATKLAWAKRQPKTYDVLEAKKPKKVVGFARPKDSGWILIVGDVYGGGMTVYHSAGVLRFTRQDSTCRYGVIGDDTGKSFKVLSHAEHQRDKIWGKV